jgi:heptosyltransferase-2
VDRILLYDSAGRHGGWLGRFRLVGKLRKGRFHLAILFQNAFEAALLAYLAGIPQRLGYDTDWRGLFLTHGIKTPFRLEQIHEIDYYLGLLQMAGLNPDGRHLTLELTEHERRRAEEILTKEQIKAYDRLVGVSPGASYGSAKRWYPERYARLCDRIHQSYGAPILILGGPGEEAIGRQVSDLMKYHSVNLCGRIKLREAMALIEKCRLFVTNDSGLMHIAAALDVPLVAIFGSTNPITTGPSSPRSRVVRVPVCCSPCLKSECPQDHRCMKEIDVNMVYAEADALFREN